MHLLFAAVPTLFFFGAQFAGMTQSIASLAAAALAGFVIWFQGRKGWPRDPVFLGCNIHFLVAGPLLWALFLSRLDGVAKPLLDHVLLGVPFFVLIVLIWRAARRAEPWPVVAVAALGLGLAAFGSGSYITVITVPLTMVLLARLAFKNQISA